MVHIVGISVCLMGVGCLVWAGIDDNKDLSANGKSKINGKTKFNKIEQTDLTDGSLFPGKNQLVGDMLCLGGAVLFSVITVLQELAVKTVDIIEYLGMIGFFGTILSCIQM